MSAVTIKIEGLEMAMKRIKGIESDALRKNVLLSMYRKAGKPLLEAMQRNAEQIINDNGQLAQSIGFIRPKTTKSAALLIGPRVKGSFRDRDKGGWYGHFFEFGTAPRQSKSGHRTGRIVPKPWARPAYDSTKDQVTSALEQATIKTVQSYARRGKI